MKKIIALWLLGIFAFALFACNEKEALLEMSNYGEQFRSENDNLFPNLSCEHSIVYRDASAYLTSVDAKLYHMSVCKYGNCDYEIQYEPHVLVFYTKYPYSGYPTYAENGYLYHNISAYCLECANIIQLDILCEKQDIDCGRVGGSGGGYSECLAGDRDWEKVFEGLPYEIEIRD